MNWWFVLLGIVLLTPALLLVIGLYVAWLIRALDLLDDDLRRTMTNDEVWIAVLYWLVHFLTLTGAGIALVLAGLRV